MIRPSSLLMQVSLLLTWVLLLPRCFGERYVAAMIPLRNLPAEDHGSVHHHRKLQKGTMMSCKNKHRKGLKHCGMMMLGRGMGSSATPSAKPSHRPSTKPSYVPSSQPSFAALLCRSLARNPKTGHLYGHSAYQLLPRLYDYSLAETYVPTIFPSCCNRTAHLAAIEDEEENQFIASLYAMAGWIGLTDRDQEGTYVWLDGTNYSYTNWAGGVPDNSSDSYDCAYIEGGLWKMDDCSRGNSAIVEYDCNS